VLTSGGEVKCWGQGGALGDGTTVNRSTPVTVSGLASSVAAIAAGGYHTCAVTTGGGAKCWGSDSYGELGDGAAEYGGYRTIPVNVSGLASGVAAIAPGLSHTCALIGTGGVKCWGTNEFGQLGDGAGGRTTQSTTPVDVVAASLVINHITGQPGSFFTLIGSHFAPNSATTIMVNGRALTTTLPINASGEFIFFLNTIGADEGYYIVTTNANFGTLATFTLDKNSPLRPQEGGGLTLRLPFGIAFNRSVYLTLIRR
jgi:hypothetical protein